MEDVHGPPPASLADPVIEPDLLPPGQNLWLPFGQIGLHRKVRPRQIDSLLEVNALETHGRLLY